MIRTLEIPKERWTSFVGTLDRLLRGRPIRVEVLGRPLGDQEMGDRCPFRSLYYEVKGSEADTLTITVGSERGELNHRIVRPVGLYLAQDQIGEIKWLGIQEHGEAGDAETIVYFEHLPELEAEYHESA
jgi:hypothetical protein